MFAVEGRQAPEFGDASVAYPEELQHGRRRLPGHTVHAGADRDPVPSTTMSSTTTRTSGTASWNRRQAGATCSGPVVPSGWLRKSAAKIPGTAS